MMLNDNFFGYMNLYIDIKKILLYFVENFYIFNLYKYWFFFCLDIISSFVFVDRIVERNIMID